MTIPIKISMYKRFRVWLNKKTSLLLKRRSKSKDYLSLETNVLTILIDGFIASLALIYFIPLSFIGIISIGCSIFLIKLYLLKWITTIFSSLNLIKITR